MLKLAFVIILAAAGPALAEDALVVSKAEYGSRWPYPGFTKGIVQCNTHAVTIVLGNNKFGVNGKAVGRDGYPDSRSQMRRSKDGYYTLGDVDGIIERGMRLCSE